MLKSSAILSCCLFFFIACLGQKQPDQPVKTSRDCPHCPEMVTVPAGHFVMGSPAGEPGRSDTEGPQTMISISSFAIGKYPVTKAEWRYFVEETHRSDHGGCAWSGLPGKGKPWDLNPDASWKKLGFEQDDHHPVVCITWQDVQDYLAWIGKKTGKKYRLLSESEWEYASRAGAETAYPWGASPSHDEANYGADSGYVGMAKGKDRWVYTSPVNSFPPNKFGLCDMAGNVNVYLADYFAATYNDLPRNGSPFLKDTVLSLKGEFSDMSGSRSSMYRMIRGGTFGDPPVMLRSAYRNWTPGPGATLENYASSALGFRLAYSLSPAWPDSLDALRAAPQSHRVVYENDSIRLLEVTVLPHTREPIHTHQWPSIMFGHHGADTGENDLVYYAYRYEPATGKMQISDSIPVHHARQDSPKPEIAALMEPEGPHSIRNTSDRPFQVYRIEFKSK